MPVRSPSAPIGSWIGRAFAFSRSLICLLTFKKMSAKTEEILESLKSLSLLEASELVKQIEEAFGVSAAASAGVVMAAPGAAGGDADGGAAEEKTEFDVVLESFDAAAKI